jgi:hypothetical protein
MALNNNIVHTFRKAFEENCFELIIRAYLKALTEKKYQLGWMENDFSELLSFYVNDDKSSIDKNITCKTENKFFNNPAKLIKGYADRLPRIDFVYSKIWSHQRFEYFMEAKRLKENDPALKRAYINEGMDRFINKKYPVGCMLGYLLEGNTVRAINGINSLLEKDQRSTEILVKIDNELFESYYESIHPNIGILKHLIFDFTVKMN